MPSFDTVIQPDLVELRNAVNAKQGAAFDIRQFHEILRLGAMPLVLLEREVMRRA